MILHFTITNSFCNEVATFSLQNITGLDDGLDGTSRPRSVSTSANQIHEFDSSQSLWDKAI